MAEDKEKMWKKQGNAVMKEAAEKLKTEEEKEKKRRAKGERRKNKK